MGVIKAVLFDLDDTLWPITPVIARAEVILYDWLKQHAPAVTQQFTIESLREWRQRLMASDPVFQLDLRMLRHAALTEAFLSTGEDIAMVDEAMAVFSRARNEVTVFKDVHPTLTRLQRQFALGSVSNGVADLEKIGLSHYFQTSIAAYQFGKAKPDPAIFHAACDALGVAAGEAVYVGDDLILDVEGAQQAGMQAIWINRVGAELPSRLLTQVQPDAICTTLSELEYWLLS